ncbi:MAG: nucleotide exchange factor GrpE [Gemmatimonadetes bacterium]|nr:nucleotide exchange factor GrpE [Gemmatimonadota bacterium]
MKDERVKQDPTKTSSFENRAVDATDAESDAAASAADAGDVIDEDATGSTGEHMIVGEEAGLVTSALQHELAEQKEKYVRLYAEFENFRRRAVKDRQDAEHRGMGNLLRGLLESLDDLARVAHMTPAKSDTATVLEGVALVERKLLKSLAGHGLEVVDPKGHPFDPALHEAISTAPAASKEEDHLVAQVFQVGYVFNGTLLRPARVVVTQWNG